MSEELNLPEELSNKELSKFVNSFFDENFQDSQIEKIIKNYLQQGLERKSLRKEYDLTYDILSRDPDLLNLKQNIRKISISMLAARYFTTEEEIKSILRSSTISKNKYQNNYSSAYF